MRVSRTSDFCIRILCYLAVNKDKTTNRFISKQLQIPYAYLVKLIRALSKNKYIKTSKGKGGGIEILKDPKEISVCEIIELNEGPIVMSDCFIDPKYCKLDKTCGLRKKIFKLQSDVVSVLKKTKIADIM